MTVIDRFTRWPQASLVADTCAPTIAKSLVSGWISRFSVLLFISANRGAQFQSKLFQELMVLIGTSRIHTMVYHPSASDLLERFHRTLKAALNARSDSNNWSTLLPIVLLGLRSIFKPDLGCTAADASPPS